MKSLPLLIVNRHPHTRISLRSLKTKTTDILACLSLGDATVEITLVDDAFMRRMNRKHMGKSGSTDVLSFPAAVFPKTSDYRGKYLGDILISLDRAGLQAKVQKISLAREVVFLIVHSVLHLIGHDHAKAGERLKMQKLESKIWKSVMRIK